MKGNTASKKWQVLATVCTALFMIMFQGNVVNLAIPKMMGDLGADLTTVQWVTNGYLLAFTAFILTMGRLGDEIGRKRVFLIGLITYATGALLCGFSSNVILLILSSVLQGIGGSAMMPATLSLIAANFEKKERGMAMGIWGAVSGLAVAIGPVAGGYITDLGLGTAINGFLHITQNWRYIYFINTLIGLVVIALTFRFIPESKDTETRHHFDLFGIALSSITMFLFTFAIMEGSKYGWFFQKEAFTLFGVKLNPGGISIVPVLFVLSVAIGAFFLRRESRIAVDPLVDVKFFRDGNFTIGSFIAGVLNFAMMGSLLLVPIFLQAVLGHTAIETGFILLPLAVAIIIVSPVAGKLSDIFGPKFIIMIGMAVMALGCLYLGNFRADIKLGELFLPLVVLGIGLALPMSPITNTALRDIPLSEVGGASGLLSMLRQLGSVMGIAILVAVMQTVLVGNIERNIRSAPHVPGILKTKIVESAKEGHRGMGGASEMPAGMQAMVLNFQQVQEEIGGAMKKSFAQSINFTFRIAAAIALFGAFLAFFLKNPAKKEEKNA